MVENPKTVENKGLSAIISITATRQTLTVALIQCYGQSFYYSYQESLQYKGFAPYLGVQRPSLFRELKKMKDEGIIEIDNRTIQL